MAQERLPIDTAMGVLLNMAADLEEKAKSGVPGANTALQTVRLAISLEIHDPSPQAPAAPSAKPKT